MTYPAFFSKPAWSHFLDVQGLDAILLPALVMADTFFDWVAETKTVKPTPHDYLLWSSQVAGSGRVECLEHLLSAFMVLIPGERRNILAALDLSRLKDRADQKNARPTPTPRAAQRWDPCAKPVKYRDRSVSVFPWNLPAEWQAHLKAAAQGEPGVAAKAPAKEIIRRMRDKLCQLAWSVGQVNMRVQLSRPAIDLYLSDLELRLDKRERGIRWATMRATAEELYRFSRYADALSVEDFRYLRRRLTRYELLEKGQDALKFYALLETGNTTLKIIDRADTLLSKAQAEPDARKRHKLRNCAAILGLYSVVPLRNADADLILGETLIWQTNVWVIDTMISKTMSWHPEALVVPLKPTFGRYVDAVVLGDHHPRHLPTLRHKLSAERRQLFVHHNGKRPCPTYIARMFKESTGTSFTTTRTMLHTDQAISRGDRGTRDAMAAAHQTSEKTAKKYQAKSVRRAAIERVQNAASHRRATLVDRDLAARISALKES
jgi:hypothetical protein